MKCKTGLVLALSIMNTAALAQGFGPPPGPIPSAQGGIVWYGTLRTGLAEARRLNRPVLLMSAAPHCHNIPGIW